MALSSRARAPCAGSIDRILYSFAPHFKQQPSSNACSARYGGGHMRNRSTVQAPSRARAESKYRRAEQTSETAGVGKARGKAGGLKRSARTPIHTRTKADKVPILTSSPANPIGKMPASAVTAAPIHNVVK